MYKIEVVCRALIIDDENRVLIVKKTGSDFWSLPGGKLDADDASVQACLIRELQEELGVGSVVNDIHLVQELHKNNTRYIELIWRTKLASDPTHIQGNICKISHGELSDIVWIKKDDLRNANIKPEFLKNLV